MKILNSHNQNIFYHFEMGLLHLNWGQGKRIVTFHTRMSNDLKLLWGASANTVVGAFKKQRVG